MQKKYAGLKCSICGKEYEADALPYVCPRDGGNLDVILDYAGIQQKYDIEDIKSRTDGSLWRYLPLLPVGNPGGEFTPLRTAGWTPVYAPSVLAQELGLNKLWVKDEGRNPTASFKDRASAVVIAKAREMQKDVVVTASTGNAGAALAGMAAAVGQKTVIFAPKTAPQAKIAQLLVFGAQVILVDGTYDEAFDLSVQASNEFGWYCRNTGYNPFTVEGKKTASFEIWETVILEMLDQTKPLSIFVSVGDGNIISGLHKGFKDLETLGWLEQMPRIFGIQSTKSAAVANAFFAKTEEIVPVSATTVADSISVDLPRDGVRAVRAARDTGGAYITVKDEDILSCIADLGKVGIFAEPAGSAAYAGLKKAISLGLIKSEDPILVINTGSGLKDVKAALHAVSAAPIIEPDMKALKSHLGV
ncbi:MAG: threonine synthase [Anaerolineaceae bacterium]|nr:threonine synthase [Anaerolineaceae bacterium]